MRDPHMLVVRINYSPHYDGTPPAEPGNFEACNFVPVVGRYYGAIPKGDRVDLSRLGGGTKSSLVNDVTLLWIARHPSVSRWCIMGWYRHAQVFRVVQRPHPANQNLDYRAVCLVQNGHELEDSDRLGFDVLGAGYRMGRSRRWYPDPVRDVDFILKVHEYADAKHPEVIDS